MAPAASKAYDEIVIVALLMALKAKGGSLAEPLKDMVNLDGSRSNSSFEHSLRAANKLAATLNDKKAAGQALTPADMGNDMASSAPSSTAKITPKKRSDTNGTGTPTSKRARKSPAKSKTVSHNDSEGEEVK